MHGCLNRYCVSETLSPQIKQFIKNDEASSCLLHYDSQRFRARDRSVSRSQRQKCKHIHLGMWKMQEGGGVGTLKMLYSYSATLQDGLIAVVAFLALNLDHTRFEVMGIVWGIGFLLGCYQFLPTSSVCFEENMLHKPNAHPLKLCFLFYKFFEK